jgi:hypothetical protein
MGRQNIAGGASSCLARESPEPDLIEPDAFAELKQRFFLCLIGWSA